MGQKYDHWRRQIDSGRIQITEDLLHNYEKDRTLLEVQLRNKTFGADPEELEDIKKIISECERFLGQRKEEIPEEKIVIGEGQYQYESAGKTYRTNNPAVAARYDAQHRYFQMSKLKQTLARAQYKRFQKLWIKVDTPSKEEQEKIADEMNGMFR